MQTNSRRLFRRLGLRRPDAGIYSGTGYTLIRLKPGFWRIEVASYPLNGLQRQERLPGLWSFRLARKKAQEHAMKARARFTRRGRQFTPPA